MEKAVSDFDATCIEGEATDGEAESAREDRLRNMAEDGATAIVGVGFAYSESVNAVAPDAVRLAPPLVVTADQLGEFTAALPTLLDDSLEHA